MLIFRSTVFLVAGAAMLAACTTAPNLGSATAPENRNTTSGAVMGAALGAAISGASGGGGKQNAGAALAGAALGGLIGRQLDQQAAQLRQDLGDGITVSNQGDHLLVNFPQDILFATDSASIKASQRSELTALASNLQSYPDTNVTIIGHTDNTGTAAHNFDLSTRRAGAVSSILVGAGVSGNRINATGRGEDAPIASNLTPEGRAQNRRVEVVIRPNGA